MEPAAVVKPRPAREFPVADRLLVIACGMLAREILAVREQLGLTHLELRCLPAEHHFQPDRIAPALDAAIAEAKAEGYRDIFVGYADCGTGGMLDRVCEKHGVARLAGPHCFASYQGLDAFSAIEDADMTAFYMTDFLCRQFEAFFIRPLGLDRHPELARDYFGNYEKLVYLAQTDNPALDRVAIRAAAMLGLAYEKRRTGYGDLVPALARAGAHETAL
ncbi:MAG: DUF1638 domain-containing protein [Rhizobiaceae bacterium]|nr:DUF1638 domain-containing protein [Rhizobiaceae bacterium]